MATRHSALALSSNGSSFNPITGEAVPLRSSNCAHMVHAASTAAQRASLPFFVPRQAGQEAYQPPERKPLHEQRRAHAQVDEQAVVRPMAARDPSDQSPSALLQRSARRQRLASPVSEHVICARPARAVETSVVSMAVPPPFGLSEIVVPPAQPIQRSAHSLAHEARQQVHGFVAGGAASVPRPHFHATKSSLDGAGGPHDAHTQLEALRSALMHPSRLAGAGGGAGGGSVVTVSAGSQDAMHALAQVLQQQQQSQNHSRGGSRAQSRSLSRADSRALSPRSVDNGPLSPAASIALIASPSRRRPSSSLAALRSPELLSAAGRSSVAAGSIAAAATAPQAFGSRYVVHGLASSVQLDHPADFVDADIGLPKQLRQAVRQQEIGRASAATAHATAVAEAHQNGNGTVTSVAASRALSAWNSRQASAAHTPAAGLSRTRSGSATPRVATTMDNAHSSNFEGADSHLMRGRAGAWTSPPPAHLLDGDADDEDAQPGAGGGGGGAAEGIISSSSRGVSRGASAVSSRAVSRFSSARSSRATSRAASPPRSSSHHHHHAASTHSSRARSAGPSGSTTPRGPSASASSRLQQQFLSPVQITNNMRAAGRPTLILSQVFSPKGPATSAAAAACPASAGGSRRSHSGSATPVNGRPSTAAAAGSGGGRTALALASSLSPSPRSAQTSRPASRSGSRAPSGTSTPRASRSNASGTSAQQQRAAQVQHLQAQLARLQGELRSIHGSPEAAATPSSAARKPPVPRQADLTAAAAAIAATTSATPASPASSTNGLHLHGLLRSMALGNSNTLFGSPAAAPSSSSAAGAGIGGVKARRDNALLESDTRAHSTTARDQANTLQTVPARAPAGLSSRPATAATTGANAAMSSSAAAAAAASSSTSLPSSYSIASPPHGGLRVLSSQSGASSFASTSLSSVEAQRPHRHSGNGRARTIKEPFVHPDDESLVPAPVDGAYPFAHTASFEGSKSLPLGGPCPHDPQAQMDHARPRRPKLGPGVLKEGQDAYHQTSSVLPLGAVAKPRKSTSSAALKLWKV